MTLPRVQIGRSDFRSMHSSLSQANAALQVVQGTIGGRGFFGLSDGRLGTAWPKARKGDKICILFGHDVPLILRPERDRWSLIGDAYVHKAMAVSKVYNGCDVLNTNV